MNTLVIRTNEICLKSGNRGFFEQKLVEQIRFATQEFGMFHVKKQQGSFIIELNEELSTGQIDGISQKLGKVFGIGNFSFGTRCDKDFARIKEVAIGLMAGRQGSFKVESRRSDKMYPLQSPAISREIGAAILDANDQLSVDVRKPEIVLNVEIHKDFAFVSNHEVQGAGGLPTGTSGTLVVLLSGGIDSPVAAWKTMRRGCKAIFVHFWSYPFADSTSVEKAKRLAEKLSAWQGETTLYNVAIGEAQKELVAKTKPELRVILYRRLMMRIAEKIAEQAGALGLVTGESIGQVASQTLENMQTTSDAVKLPIYRPLVGDDKDDIVRVAKRIDTFTTSIEAHDDCCSTFMPPHPATRAKPKQAFFEEQKVDVAAMIAGAMATMERIVISPKTSSTVILETAWEAVIQDPRSVN